jgi:N-methylhydantoinase A/oxoprolinase/acetone carboxylase beta subunit
VHAYSLATKLGVPRIIVPLRAGVLSAVGLLIAPAAYDVVRTHKVPLTRVDPDSVEAVFREMTEEVRRMLAAVEPDGTMTFARAVDVGYIGQGYQVTVPVEGSSASLGRDELWRRFARLYREKYGYFYDDVAAEVVNLRLAGQLRGRELTLRPLEPAGTSPAGPKEERPAFSARRRRTVPFAVYDRSELRPGTAFAGPAIVEEPSSTTVLDVDGRLEVDAYGSLVITVGGES